MINSSAFRFGEVVADGQGDRTKEAGEFAKEGGDEKAELLSEDGGVGNL